LVVECTISSSFNIFTAKVIGLDYCRAAGLLHDSAAADWNDTQPKCPIHKVIVKELKEKIQYNYKAWNQQQHEEDSKLFNQFSYGQSKSLLYL
jgi:HD superfamily phosphodiesterase